MKRRALQLRYVIPVTLFVLTQVALIAFFAVTTPTLTPTSKVSARGLDSSLTAKQNTALFSRSQGRLDSVGMGQGGDWQILHQSSGGESIVDTPTDTATPANTATNTPTNTFTKTPLPTNTPTATLTICPSGACTNTPTPTPTNTPTPTLTNTPTNTATPCPSANCTSTPTSTNTRTTTPTLTTTPVCEDAYESDNNLSQAKELLPGIDQIHTLCKGRGGSKDYDWVQFGAVAGKRYTVLTKDLTNPVDTIITLHGADGSIIAQNDDFQASSLASMIVYTFTASATYYLEVTDSRSNGGLGYSYTLSLVPEGLAATATPNGSATPTPGPCHDTYEPDGLPETAQIILIGTAQHPSTQNRSFCPSGDADWARFYARAGKVYSISTSNLGIGVDSYMYIFTSDVKTILAQNDDGGDPANPLASRIDFYPQKDDWYLIQVKNAGDIGGSEQTYDLSLAVLAGVPQPPGTATSVTAPATATATGPSATPRPTNSPVPTPTQGAAVGTPTPKPLVLTGPQPKASPIQEVLPFTSNEIDASSGGNVSLPNVPLTGFDPGVQTSIMPVKDIAAAVTLPQKLQGPSAYTSLQFHIFYDHNRDKTFNPVEGIRGMKVYFLNTTAGMMMSGQLITSSAGTGNAILPVVPQQIFIPYLGINVPLTSFPEQAEHSLWLPPVNLPDRVP